MLPNHSEVHHCGRGGVAWQHRGLWSLSPEFKSRPRPTHCLRIFRGIKQQHLTNTSHIFSCLTKKTSTHKDGLNRGT